MKKYFFAATIFIVLITLFFILRNKNTDDENMPLPVNESISQKVADINDKANTSMANPASKYCEEHGGKLEIVNNSDGSQFGLCQFEKYACEEWVYFKGECTIEADAEKIKNALIKKGLNISNMKIVISKHLGKYIGGGVIPDTTLGGGGYIFAVKEGDEVRILADGNGAIMCSAFTDYPQFPSYLVPECIDNDGNQVTR